jgi:hypothetical protein
MICKAVQNDWQDAMQNIQSNWIHHGQGYVNENVLLPREAISANWFTDTVGSLSYVKLRCLQ